MDNRIDIFLVIVCARTRLRIRLSSCSYRRSVEIRHAKWSRRPLEETLLIVYPSQPLETPRDRRRETRDRKKSTWTTRD
jgi:transcriptional regulator of met regulon